MTEQLAAELVSLPLDPTHTPDEIVRVVGAVRAFFLGAIETKARPTTQAPARQIVEPAVERGA